MSVSDPEKTLEGACAGPGDAAAVRSLGTEADTAALSVSLELDRPVGKNGVGWVLVPEACPAPTAFQAESCQDAVVVDAAETVLQSLGRIVQVDAVVKNVCPGRRLAVAVLLTEEDANGTERSRGMKTFAIPPQAGTDCRDLELKCVQFVVPEGLEDGGTASLCSARQFKVRVLANYTDTDFVCCEARSVMS